MVSRLLTPGLFSASKRITVSVSVTALLIFFAVTFGLVEQVDQALRAWTPTCSS